MRRLISGLTTWPSSSVQVCRSSVSRRLSQRGLPSWLSLSSIWPTRLTSSSSTLIAPTRRKRTPDYTNEEDDRILKMTREGYDLKEISDQLGRPPRSIVNRRCTLRRLFFTRTQAPRRYTAAEDEQIRRQLAKGQPLHEIAKEMGRTYDSVRNRLYSYLKTSPTSDSSIPQEQTGAGSRTRQAISHAEALKVIELRRRQGLRWRDIAARFPTRSISALQLVYYYHLKSSSKDDVGESQ